MKFGLAFASSAGTESDTALEICQIAEKVGFESVWGGEHVIFPSSIENKYSRSYSRNLCLSIIIVASYFFKLYIFRFRLFSKFFIYPPNQEMQSNHL